MAKRPRLAERRVIVALGIAWTAAISAITAPSALGGVGSWLDSSWQVGLDLSHRLNLPMGARLFFPYGPYGYLTVRTPFFFQQWLEAVVAAAVMHIILVSLICMLLLRRRVSPAVWIAVTATVLIGLPAFAGPDTEGQLVAILLAYLSVDVAQRRWSITAATLCGLTLALLILMKATAVPLTTGVIVLAIAGLVIRRRHIAAVGLLLAFLFGGGLLWVAAGLGVGDVSSYVRAALEFGSGYSVAMYFMGLTPGIVLGGAVIAGLGILGVYLLLRRRHRDGLWILLTASSLFPLFKDSFVRDGPVRDQIYFGVVAVVAALGLAVVAPAADRWWSKREIVPVGVLAGCMLLGAVWRAGDLSVVTGAGDRLVSYGTVVSALLDRGARRSLLAEPLRRAHDYYAPILSALPPFPPGSTVDVMPWDIGLFYEDGNLNWHPRPVMQSYSAYTSWLDELDAAFLRGSSAPDYIIYSYTTIDDRYAAFDEPATFQVLLNDYRVVKMMGSSVAVLHRVPGAATPTAIAPMVSCAALGAPISVPHTPGTRTFAQVDVSRSLPGRLLDLLAKGPDLRIALASAAGSVQHRLVGAVAGDGLYVSDLLTSTADISSAMAGTGGVPLTSLAVTGNPAGWASRYCVTFNFTPIHGQGP